MAASVSVSPTVNRISISFPLLGLETKLSLETLTDYHQVNFSSSAITISSVVKYLFLGEKFNPIVNVRWSLSDTFLVLVCLLRQFRENSCAVKQSKK